MLGSWLDMPSEAGLLAWRLAPEMAGTHLRDGYDVQVPQLLGRLDFVLTLAETSERAGASLVEIALLSSAEDVAERFVRRTQQSYQAEHQAAAPLLT